MHEPFLFVQRRRERAIERVASVSFLFSSPYFARQGLCGGRDQARLRPQPANPRDASWEAPLQVRAVQGGAQDALVGWLGPVDLHLLLLGFGLRPRAPFFKKETPKQRLFEQHVLQTPPQGSWTSLSPYKSSEGGWGPGCPFAKVDGTVTCVEPFHGPKK